MKYIPACLRLFLVSFGFLFGGLTLCGAVAVLLIKWLGFDHQATRIGLFLLLIPALISFLLGLGLGQKAFYDECARIAADDDDEGV